MVVFYSIENPNQDFLFHSTNYTPIVSGASLRWRFNLFRYVT